MVVEKNVMFMLLSMLFVLLFQITYLQYFTKEKRFVSWLNKKSFRLTPTGFRKEDINIIIYYCSEENKHHCFIGDKHFNNLSHAKGYVIGLLS